MNLVAKTELTPWDGLGSKLNQKESIDNWVKNTDLDWQAKRTKVLFNVSDEIVQGSSDVLYRSDNNFQLGIVTDKYQIVQPKEVVEFYRDLVKLEGWKLDVMGTMDGGKRIWALAKTDASFFVSKGEDLIDTYFLLSTTFDGTSSTIGKFTSIRVVCQNTLTLALGKNEGLGKVSVPHKASFDAKKMKEKLGIYKKATEVFQGQVQQLVETKIDDHQAVRFLIDTLEKEGADPDRLSARQGNIIKNVFELYAGQGMGSQYTSSKGTAWGLLNALTQHIDYNVGRNVNNRMRAAWFGAGETLKLQAMSKLLQIA